MSERRKLTWTTPQGREVVLTVGVYLDRVDTGAIVDGKTSLLLSQEEPTSLSLADRPELVARLGNLGLTAEQRDWLATARAAVQAEIDADPEVIARQLVEAHTRLIRARSNLVYLDHEQHVRAVERLGNGDPREPQIDYRGQTAQATAELEAWEAAHPETMRQIADQAAKDLARHMWD